MSPGYHKEWVQNPDLKTGHWTGGFAREFSVCMSCILKLEPWLEGKDFRLPGQLGLVYSPDSSRTNKGPSSPLLAWLLDVGMSWD